MIFIKIGLGLAGFFLLAVLTAAIAAYRSEEGLPEGGFRVVSFKRAGGRAWNAKK